MQGDLVRRKLSVKRLHCDKTEERSVQIFTPYERSFSLVFWEEECLLGASPSTWNFGSTGPRWSEIADFWQSVNTNRKSTPCSAPLYLRTLWHYTNAVIIIIIIIRWSSYVAPKPPTGGLKNVKFVWGWVISSKPYAQPVWLSDVCQWVPL